MIAFTYSVIFALFIGKSAAGADDACVRVWPQAVEKWDNLEVNHSIGRDGEQGEL